MQNIRDIFKNSEAAAPAKPEGAAKETNSDRKMYCPSCYKDYYTDDDNCPVCGCKLEKPMSEEEEEEMAEIFFATRT